MSQVLIVASVLQRGQLALAVREYFESLVEPRDRSTLKLHPQN